MALIDTWTGRCNPVTKQPVVMRLYRFFDASTLKDIFMIELESGAKKEVLENLSPASARQKWESNKKWWA